MVSDSRPPESARATAARRTRSRFSRLRPLPFAVVGIRTPLLRPLTSLRCKRKPYNVSQRRGDPMTIDQTAPAGRPQVATMRAVVQDRYGDTADVLRPAEVARPEPGAGEVLVRVAAAGVDRGVWHLMAGKPYAARLAFGLRAPRNPVRGREFAGRVESVGAGVAAVRPGDEVFGVGGGSFAEYVVASGKKVAPAPAGLTPVEAAAMPVSASTALQAVRDHGHVSAGQRVLVIGASGGVGAFAVQIAKASGAEVTGVCSTAKVDLVRSLGADGVIDYTQTDLAASGVRYDVVLDIGGDRP